MCAGVKASSKIFMLSRSLQAVEKGWSQGPYSEDQLPQGCIVSKRFAAEQGLKVGPIDDLKRSLVNSAYSRMAAMARYKFTMPRSLRQRSS